MAEVLHISTTARKQVVDLTDQVEAVIRRAKMQEGLCLLFITHTTAALTTGEVGEGTEQDFLQVVEQMIPRIHSGTLTIPLMPGRTWLLRSWGRLSRFRL